MNGVFLDAAGLEKCDLAQLNGLFGSLQIFENSRPEEVVERIGDAPVIIINKVRVTREVLEQKPDLRLVCIVATGTDCVDLQAAKEFGVTVCNCRAYGTDSVVQHVFTSILALHTSLLPYTQAVGNGRWQKSEQFCFLDYPIVELKGKTLGIVGYGTLGQGVARIAKAFGMEVVVAARPGKTDDPRPSVKEILGQVDVLSLHCPLTDDTRGLIGKEELALMKPTAFLVNGARGGIVDEAALASALRAGTIAGAATDVLSVEPPRDGNPLLADDIPHLIVTPHVAWGSAEARQRLIDQTVENVLAWSKGQPLRDVQP